MDVFAKTQKKLSVWEKYSAVFLCSGFISDHQTSHSIFQQHKKRFKLVLKTQGSYILPRHDNIVHHTTPAFCDADYILMLNSVIEYNHAFLSLLLTTTGRGLI